MIDIDHDRRHDQRISLVRPCKVYEPRSGRYVPGSTCNVSSTGMLLRVFRPLSVEPGDRVYIGVSQRRQQGVMRSDEMIEATVVRKEVSGGTEATVAVRIDDAGQLNLPLRAAA